MCDLCWLMLLWRSVLKHRACCTMAAPSDSGALSVVMASDGESVGSILGVATSRSNASVASMVVGSSESNVTDMAVGSSRASDICLAASDSDSGVGQSVSGGLPRPGQALEVVSRDSNCSFDPLHAGAAAAAVGHAVLPRPVSVCNV